jgi:D-galactarolactone cycloisomerase
LRTPLAGGENEHTLFGFRELLGRHAVDIAQPDLGSCGGISAAHHIVALAQAHSIEVNPHVWGSAVAQAASLQAIAALPIAHSSVFARDPVLEYDRSPHPFRRELVTEPIVLIWSMALCRSRCRPGLGITIRPETISRYRVN